MRLTLATRIVLFWVLGTAVTLAATPFTSLAVAIPLGAFTGAVLSALLLMWHIRETLQAARQLREAAKAVEEGRFDVRVAERGDNEVGDLSRAFNRMIETLDTKHRVLAAERERHVASLREFQAAVESVSRIMTSNLPLHEALEAACRESARILKADAAALYLAPGPDTDGAARLHVFDGNASRTLEGAEAATLRENPLIARCMRESRVLASSPARATIPAFPRARSLLLAPLLANNQVYGCLVLADFSDHYRFGEKDFPRARIFSMQMAAVVYHGLLYDAQATLVARLKDQENRYRTVVECANDGILIRQGKDLVFANEAFQRMVGPVPIPMDAHEFLERWAHPEDLPSVYRRLQERLEGELYTMRYEVRFVRPDGRVVPVEISSTAVTYGGTWVSQMFVRDLTDQKAAARAIQESSELLMQSEKMAAIGSLAAGVAHEINNPLAFIKGNDQLVIDVLDELETLPECRSPTLRPLIDEVRQSIEINLGGVNRIERIVQSLRQFAKPTRERIATDVNGIVENTLTLAMNRVKGRVHIETRLAPDLPPVPCSPDEIGQILLNLLVNAVDACPQEGGAIRITSRREGGFVLVDVADNGCGIPDSVAQNLFNPFYTTKKHGTGLGLSISQRIANGHGGSLTFRSRVNAGTIFTLKLPIQTPTVPAAAPGGA